MRYKLLLAIPLFALLLSYFFLSYSWEYFYVKNLEFKIKQSRLQFWGKNSNSPDQEHKLHFHFIFLMMSIYQLFLIESFTQCTTTYVFVPFRKPEKPETPWDSDLSVTWRFNAFYHVLMVDLLKAYWFTYLTQLFYMNNDLSKIGAPLHV